MEYVLNYEKFFESNKLKGGLSDKYTLEDISKKHNYPLDKLKQELKKGIETELEHTTDRDLAEEIAMDHLVESPIYYQKLEELEKSFENKKNWISDTEMKKGGLSKALGYTEKENIPSHVIDEIIKEKEGSVVKVKDKDIKITKRLKKQAVLAKNLKKMK